MPDLITEDESLLTVAIADMSFTPWQNDPTFSSPAQAYNAQRSHWLRVLTDNDPFAADIFAENYPERRLTEHGQVESIAAWVQQNVVEADVKTTKRDDVLQTASRLIHGDRQQDYGEPIDSFTRLAAAFNIVLEGEGLGTISPTGAAKLMIALKFSRLAGGDNKDDTWVDLAGYAALGAEVFNS